MGQYHSVINLDQMTGYSPRAVGSSVKLSEQAHTTASCAALVALVAEPFGWAGDRVAVVGDYTRDTDLPESPYPASELYVRLAEEDGIADVGEHVRDVIGAYRLGTVVPTDFGYDFAAASVDPIGERLADDVVAVCHDLGECLTPQGLGGTGTLTDAALNGTGGGFGTALTVLLAAACKGRVESHSDIESTDPLIGSWAGHRVSVTANPPEGLRDITGAIANVLTDANWVHSDRTYPTQENARR